MNISPSRVYEVIKTFKESEGISVSERDVRHLSDGTKIGFYINRVSF